MPSAPVGSGHRSRLQVALHAAPWSVRLTAAAMFAALTGLLAQVEVYAPWNPYVPYTGQVFAVMAAGLVLGPGLGAASMGIYLLVGIAGVPVFADWSAGWAVLKGRTAGYLFGFVGAAYLTGALWRHYAHGPSLRRLARVGVVAVAAYAGLFAVGAVALGLSGVLATDGLAPTVLLSGAFIAGVGCVLFAWSRRESEAYMARVACALAGVVAIHVPGVVVLQAVTGMPWADAVGFGTIQFLPLDLGKAFLAAGLSGLALSPPPRPG